MSAEYVILLHENEQNWQEATPGRRQEVYKRHEEFARRCAAEGHLITDGAELSPSTDSIVVRGPGIGITDGPYTETAEQLGGFYIVKTDRRDGLVKLVAELFASNEEPVEIRQTISAQTPASKAQEQDGAPVSA